MAATALQDISAPQDTQKRSIARLGVGLPVVIVAMVMLFSFLIVPKAIDDPDIWWHLQDARLQLAQHHFLRADRYSYTAANAAWMNHEWLGELPYLAGWSIGGAMGIYLVTLASVCLVMLGILYLACKDSGTPKAAMVAMVPAIILSSVSFGPRTLIYGWMLLLVELALLSAFRKGEVAPAKLWAMPVLFAVWVNTHGSWMIGLVLFLIYMGTGFFQFEADGLYAERWSRTQCRTIYMVVPASLLALFCNPYGWRLVLYPFNMAFKQKLNIASVVEWRSVDFHVFRGKVFFITLAALFLFRMLRRSRWSLQDAALAFVAVYAGLTYSRFLFLAAILLAPLLARDLAGWMPWNRANDKRLFNLAALGFAAYMVFTQFPGRAKLASDPEFPVAAVQWLQQHPQQGRMFNEYLWGGYIEFHDPAQKTFIDSRMDIFEYNGTLKDYLDIVHIEYSLALLDKQRIDTAFIPLKSPLAYLLFHTSGWHATYQDEVAVVFARN